MASKVFELKCVVPEPTTLEWLLSRKELVAIGVRLEHLEEWDYFRTGRAPLLSPDTQVKWTALADGKRLACCFEVRSEFLSQFDFHRIAFIRN